MLSVICIALLPHLGHATRGARVSSTSPRYGRVAAAACCYMVCISTEHGVQCDWSVSKKTGSIYPCRRWSLWTLAVTVLAGIPVATHHNRLFSERHRHLKETQQTFSRAKKRCISHVSVVNAGSATLSAYVADVSRWLFAAGRAGVETRLSSTGQSPSSPLSPTSPQLVLPARRSAIPVRVTAASTGTPPLNHSVAGGGRWGRSPTPPP